MVNSAIVDRNQRRSTVYEKECAIKDTIRISSGSSSSQQQQHSSTTMKVVVPKESPSRRKTTTTTSSTTSVDDDNNNKTTVASVDSRSSSDRSSEIRIATSDVSTNTNSNGDDDVNNKDKNDIRLRDGNRASPTSVAEGLGTVAGAGDALRGNGNTTRDEDDVDAGETILVTFSDGKAANTKRQQQHSVVTESRGTGLVDTETASPSKVNESISSSEDDDDREEKKVDDDRPPSVPGVASSVGSHDTVASVTEGHCVAVQDGVISESTSFDDEEVVVGAGGAFVPNRKSTTANTTAGAEVASANAATDAANERIAELEAQLEEANAHRTRLQANMKKKRAALAQASQLNDKLSKQVVELETELTRASNENASLRTGLQKVTAVRDDLKNKVRLKQDLLKEARDERDETLSRMRKFEKERAKEQELLEHYRKLAQHTGYFKWGKQIRMLESDLADMAAEAAAAAASAQNNSNGGGNHHHHYSSYD